MKMARTGEVMSVSCNELILNQVLCNYKVSVLFGNIFFHFNKWQRWFLGGNTIYL